MGTQERFDVTWWLLSFVFRVLLLVCFQTMSGASGGGNKRVRGTTVVIPIVHGSIAMYLGKKSEETRTHRWTVYIRGLENRDISYFIKHVEFNLHESFNPAKRGT